MEGDEPLSDQKRSEMISLLDFYIPTQSKVLESPQNTVRACISFNIFVSWIERHKGTQCPSEISVNYLG